MAVLNTYDALSSKKVYRDAYSQNNALEILTLKAKNYHLDATLVEDMKSICK